MNSDLINFVVGYVIIVNIIGISLIYLKVKTNIMDKIPILLLNLIHIIVSMIGGFIGTLVGAEMLGYGTDTKLFKRWIPLIIFVEACVIIYAMYTKMN